MANTESPVCIDISKIDYYCDHLNNQVDYAVGYSDKPIEDMVESDAEHWTMINYVCFSGFGGYVSDYTRENKKPPNRVYFLLTIHPEAQNLLTDEQRARWITICKMHGLLPSYIKEENLSKSSTKKDGRRNDIHGKFFIDISDVSPTLLYIYLSTLRNLREDPGFPKAVIHLVDDLGMNFYAAYVFGSRIGITCTGHHILEVTRSYGERYPSKDAAEHISGNVTASARIAYCLRNFIREPSKFDSNLAKNGLRLSASCMLNSVAGSDVHNYLLTLREFFEEDVIKAIMSSTPEEYERHMKKHLSKKVKEAAVNGKVMRCNG